MKSEIHHPLGASGAERWMACPGSVQMSEGIADSGSGYALEGTVAHLVASTCLEQNRSPYDFVGVGIRYLDQMHDVSMEMADAVSAFTECVRDPVFVLNALEHPVDELPELIYEGVERKLSLNTWIPNSFSTMDHGGVWRLSDELYVATAADYKHGSGVPVHAKGNPQIRIYAAAWLEEIMEAFHVKKVITSIHQPRIGLGEPSFEVLDAEWLHDTYMKEVSRAAHRTYDPNAELNPGEAQCRFCRAKGRCPAFAKYVEAIVTERFTPIGPWRLPEMGRFLPEDYSDLLDNVEVVRTWAKAVEEEAMRLAFELLPEGKRVGHYKLVEGRSNRAWGEHEDVIADCMRDIGLTDDDIWTKKIVSPAQAEKLAGKRKFRSDLEELVVKPRGKPTLVHENDKRPELDPADIGLEPASASDFENEPE